MINKFRDLRQVVNDLSKQFGKEQRKLCEFFTRLNGRIPDHCKFRDRTYPQIKYEFSQDDYFELTSNGKLSINPEKLKGCDPLTRLLYSVAWKNGDLHKIQHIVDGINDVV